MNPDIAEQESINLDKIIEDAERNKTAARQFAMDACKLATIPQARLQEYKDKGFFKRFWYKIAGKQGELMRANQADLIKMQEYAWVCLSKLQEQNLIQANAIAVIRNDLQVLAKAETETRVAIISLIEKFDNRLKKTEEIVAVLDWANSVEVKEFSKEHALTCLLQITFDYYYVLRKNLVAYDRIEGRTDIEAAINKLGTDYKQQISIKEFISQLLNEIQAFGYDKFSKIITVHIEEDQYLTAEFILENVSGTGFNALYTVQDILTMSAMKNPDEVIKESLSALTNPETRYSFAELAKEILAGIMLAEEIYREQKRLPSSTPTAENATETIKAQTIENILGNYISINTHAFLDSSPSPEERIIYLESFALLFATMGGVSASQGHYISALSKFFECENPMERIELLTQNPTKINVKEIIAILNSAARQYAWLVDATFLATRDGMDTKEEAVISQICKVMNIKESEITPFLKETEIIATQTNPVDLFGSIRKINGKTDAWKTILDFRKLSLKGAFKTFKKELTEAWINGQKSDIETVLKSIDPIKYDSDGYEFLELNFIEKTAMKFGRGTCISAFDICKEKAEKFSDTADNVISVGNDILNIFGAKKISCRKKLSDIKVDKTTAISNVDWTKHISTAYDELSAFINERINALSLLERQLDLYEEGRYPEAVALQKSINL